ncbi:MAG: redoxin domain-containing protein [Bacteroidales bacterium]|nr:redoxin domain-containing protein [Bacteroidales bacterium]
MKKTSIFLLIVSALCWMSCGNDKQKNEAGNSENEEVFQSEEPTTSVVETKVFEAGEVVPISSAAEFEAWVCPAEAVNGTWTYKQSMPCVVDFYADWCPPCRQMMPTYEKLAKEYAGKVTFFELNVDDMKPFVHQLGIVGMPTLYFCGQELTVVLGMQSEEQLREYLDKLCE